MASDPLNPYQAEVVSSRYTKYPSSVYYLMPKSAKCIVDRELTGPEAIHLARLLNIAYQKGAEDVKAGRIIL